MNSSKPIRFRFDSLDEQTFEEIKELASRSTN